MDLSRLLGSMLGGGGGEGPSSSQMAALSHLMPNMDEAMAGASELEEIATRPKLIRGPGVGEDAQEWARWISIYPHYVDADRSVKQGRRVRKADALSSPSAREIAFVCTEMGLRTVLEDKCYPRDALLRGRVKVELKSPEGVLLNPRIPSRRALLLLVCAEIKKMPDRPLKS